MARATRQSDLDTLLKALFRGERMIRPAVIIRKNSLCNRSEQGAASQAILMSIYRTLKLRGHDPTKTIATALRTFLQTGKLPALPGEIVAGG